MANPKIRIAGLRASIPPGYLLGRASAGSGEVELIPAPGLQAAGNVPSVATSALKWSTARRITLTGDASGSVLLDGSADVTLPVTIAAAGSVAYLPLVTGAEPPALVSDGAGHLIAIPYP